MRLSTTLINQRRFGTPGRVSLIHGIAFLQPRDLLKVCLTNSSGNVVDSICWHVTAKSTNIPTKWNPVVPNFSPNLCVGFLFLVVHSRPCPVRPSPSFSRTQLSHTQLPHTQLSHTQLTQHTTPPHTTLSHTTHSHTTLSHTTLSHTTYHTTLSHTTPSHTTLSHTALSHTALSHTTCSHTTLLHTTLCGRCPAYGTGLALVARLVPVLAAAVCLAGVALGSIHILCGKRGTWRHRPSLCGRRGNFGTGLALVARLVPVVAAAVCRIWTHRPPFSVVGAALGDIGIHFVWQAWHLWHWAGSGGALWFPLSPRLFVWQTWHVEGSILCGTRGIRWHRPSLCVAGVALVALGWLFWRAWFPLSPRLFGKRGTWRHWSSLCAAGVALTACAGSGGTLGSCCRRGCLCGRRGIWKLRPPFYVAGVALRVASVALIALGWLRGCVADVA